MSLGWVDVAVLVGYFALIPAVGLWHGRGERSTRDYFLGGRKQHWFVVGVSLIATEVSAITFLIVPGRSFADDCWYLQMYAGAFVGRLLIAYLLLPAFYRGSVTTVYEYLGQRFGPWTRTTAAVMFFASRIVGSGIRLLAASLAIAVVFDWPVHWVVIGAAGVAVVYTAIGGIKAIIWTDVLQAGVFLGGAIAVTVFLFQVTPGNWLDVLADAHDAGKFRVFHWSWHPNAVQAFWVLVIHATIQNMAAFGVDQDLTQRMLTCRDLRRGQRSLLFNAVAGLPIVCLFLLIGALLFVYYKTRAVGGAAAESPDSVFAHFIATAIPVGWGLKGLLVSGIFAAALSSLDSALGALSSTAVTDLYRPFVRPRATDQHYLRVGRMFVLAFGVLLAGVALRFAGATDLLEEAFGWVSLLFGGMLGVFLVGVTTHGRGNDRINTAAMLSSAAGLVALKFVQERNGITYIAWPWWVVLGTAWTYGVACSFPSATRRA